MFTYTYIIYLCVLKINCLYATYITTHTDRFQEKGQNCLINFKEEKKRKNKVLVLKTSRTKPQVLSFIQHT